MDRFERKKVKHTRGHRLLSKRRTRQGREASSDRPDRGTEADSPAVPERGFVIGPVEDGSDIDFDPPRFLREQ